MSCCHEIRCCLQSCETLRLCGSVACAADGVRLILSLAFPGMRVFAAQRSVAAGLLGSNCRNRWGCAGRVATARPGRREVGAGFAADSTVNAVRGV